MILYNKYIKIERYGFCIIDVYTKIDLQTGTVTHKNTSYSRRTAGCYPVVYIYTYMFIPEPISADTAYVTDRPL